MSLRTLFRLAIAFTAVVLLVAAVRDRSVDTTVLQATAESPAKLDPSVAGEIGIPRDDRLIAGLEAFVAKEMREAVELLQDPLETEARLGDVRLFTLAESAHALEDITNAREAFAALIDNFPHSPLRAVAIWRVAQICAENELWEATLDWVELARSESLPAETASDIEVLVWQMGATLERPELQTEAGRRLFVEHPQLAAELDVEESFADTLTAPELERRAQRLVENREPREALETLDLIAESQRSFDWSLLRAEALTRDHRGREAMEILASLDSSERDRRIAVAWQRALAARDASKVRRGRSNLAQSQRQEMGELARRYLEEVADLTPDKVLQQRALKTLFAAISDEDDSFERSLALLERLQSVEPTNTTGTRYLWRLGWQAYIRRDLPVAIGYWSELESLYRGTNAARSGRYWTGRAHEALGHESRALSIYREIVATAADDFYRRHARARLDESHQTSVQAPIRPTEPWPEDPLLTRARWMSDLGLQELALYELDGLRSGADPRAFCAEQAVVRARHGQRRESIQSLACAFPALGRAHQVIVPADALELYYPMDFRLIIEQRAEDQNLSPYLVFAMIRQESAFDAEARSWAGARGLMQLMPATGREVAQRLGLRYSTSRLNDPDFSVRLGTRYFRQVLDMFDGNVELALAGYNGGPYRIKRLWRRAGTNPELDRFVEGLSLEETKTYVKRIVLFEDTYRRLYAEGS